MRRNCRVPADNLTMTVTEGIRHSIVTVTRRWLTCTVAFVQPTRGTSLPRQRLYVLHFTTFVRSM